MKAIICVIAAALFSACATVSPRDAMQADVDQAAAIIERFEAIPEKGIPPGVIRQPEVWRFLPSQRPGLLVVPGAVLELSLRGRKKVGAPPPRSVRGDLASVFKLGSRSPNSLLSSTLRLLLTRLPNRPTSRLVGTSV